MFLMSQAVARILVKQKRGIIVNMSSEAGLEGSEGQSVYSATKGAINGFTRSWSKELGHYNIRVVGVAPGIMEATGLRTLAYEEALAYSRNKTVEQLRAGYSNTSTIPLGRSGKLSEVADLVSYLLSDRSSYITGVTINVAGGKTRG
jgi:sorbitol-6-phosphate 2-dehydrogenase